MVLCVQLSRTCSVPEQLISDMWIGRMSSPKNWLPTAMAPGITHTCNRKLSQNTITHIPVQNIGST